jgi:hypothetical protein
VNLLNKVYNGDTPLRKINSSELKNKLRKEIREFYDLLIKYFEFNDNEARNEALSEIKNKLHSNSEFCIFKHWLIKNKNYKDLFDLIRV